MIRGLFEEKLIKDLQAEVNQVETYKYQVKKYAPNSPNQWEKMEFIFDDYRVYAHRPGAIKIRRISDGKQVAILSGKFKINISSTYDIYTDFEINSLKIQKLFKKGVYAAELAKAEGLEKKGFEVLYKRIHLLFMVWQ